MCGITGIVSFHSKAEQFRSYLDKAVDALALRGPDQRGSFFHGRVGLGHTRLSIIDLSDAGCQPMTDATGRYTIVFNGEIYNYRELREQLRDAGTQFSGSSDTEVLLNLYIQQGADCLQRLNGFFAFAVYDKQDESLFLARDRFGIKPLHIYNDDEKLIFGSELKAILQYPVEKELDMAALRMYLQLNYTPAPKTMFQHITKLEAGHYLYIDNTGKQTRRRYYQLPKPHEHDERVPDYQAAKNRLIDLLDRSVERRLVADVPLGAFLSGGIDSSVIVALASKHTQHLNTFSIGYKDEPYFDETRYANLVADKFQTNHTVFSLSNDDLYQRLENILDYFDEPFADSSAIAVYILSEYTRKEVTVALSGDGADEMFAGYNKHWAEYRARSTSFFNLGARVGGPLWRMMPKSRNSKFGNLMRQLDRYAEGIRLSNAERYWRWCAFVTAEEADELLQPSLIKNNAEYGPVKQQYLQHFSESGDLNDNLYADMHLVLQNDMLTKVDMMSMANSLEVRVPFLDHELVEFAMELPVVYKIDNGFRKRILKDAFRDVLPAELYKRPKHGFEVPLLGWFRNELRDRIMNDWLDDDFIREQGIFNPDAISRLKQQLFSNNPGEVHARIWGLIVFQHWWKRYFAN